MNSSEVVAVGYILFSSLSAAIYVGMVPMRCGEPFDLAKTIIVIFVLVSAGAAGYLAGQRRER